MDPWGADLPAGRFAIIVIGEFAIMMNAIPVRKSDEIQSACGLPESRDTSGLVAAPKPFKDPMN